MGGELQDVAESAASNYREFLGNGNPWKDPDLIESKGTEGETEQEKKMYISPGMSERGRAGNWRGLGSLFNQEAREVMRWVDLTCGSTWNWGAKTTASHPRRLQMVVC